MNPWLVFVVLTLAVYRLTVLVVDDRVMRPIIDPIQEWSERRWLDSHPDGDRNSDQWQSPLAFFFSCSWCTSAWVAGITVCVVDAWFEPIALPVLVALAASGVTGFLSSVVEHD